MVGLYRCWVLFFGIGDRYFFLVLFSFRLKLLEEVDMKLGDWGWFGIFDRVKGLDF